MENKTYLHEQIEVLRGLIDTVHSQISEDIDFKQLIIILDAIGKGATRLATLIKTQQELGDERSFPDELADALKGIVPDSEGG
jgi:hypothetical protein